MTTSTNATLTDRLQFEVEMTSRISAPNNAIPRFMTMRAALPQDSALLRKRGGVLLDVVPLHRAVGMQCFDPPMPFRSFRRERSHRRWERSGRRDRWPPATRLDPSLR